MLSIRQIAKLAGVSAMTVSYALRQSENVSPETKEKILKIAKEHGYVSDPAVSNFMSQLRSKYRSEKPLGTIAFINSYPNKNEWNLWKTRKRLMEGLVQRAAERRYEFQEYYIKAADMSSERLSKLLRRRKIQGVILGNPVQGIGHLSLKWDWFSAVIQGYGIIKPDLHRVTSNHMANMFTALRNLKKYKFSSIGYVKRTSSDLHNMGTFTAAYDYFAPTLFKRVVPTLNSPNFFYAGLTEWYYKYKPEVIISLNDRVYRELVGAGIKIPEQVSFINLNIDHPNTRITGIDPQFEMLGAASVDLVIDMIMNGQTGIPTAPKYVMVKGRWNKGETVR